MVKLDYLTFRVANASNDDYKLLKELLCLDMEKFVFRSGTFYFRYNLLASFNDMIFFYFRSNNDNVNDDFNIDSFKFDEILVKLTGEGVRYVYSKAGCSETYIYNSDYDLIKILFFFFDGRINFTRLDLAVDITDEKVANLILYKLENFEYTSFSKNRVKYLKTDNKGGLKGLTYYLGSNSSDRFARIYDKALEQGLDKTWLRYEVQFKKDWANLVASLINAEDYQKVLSLLSDVFSPRDRNDNDKNKSRWKVSQFWIDLLNIFEKQKVILQRVKTDLIGFVGYVRNNLMRRLKQAFTFDKDLLADIISFPLTDYYLNEVYNSFLVSVSNDFDDFDDFDDDLVVDF